MEALMAQTPSRAEFEPPAKTKFEQCAKIEYVKSFSEIRLYYSSSVTTYDNKSNKNAYL